MNPFFCSSPSTVRAVTSFISTRHLFIVFFAFTFLAGCNATTKSSQGNTIDSFKIILPAPTPIGKAETERLHNACEAWYDSVLKSKGFNGGIVVAKKGNIIFEAYNYNTIPASMPVITDSTSLHIASVSKTFTAMAVLKLWQDGKCDIDDEFSKYFTAFNFPGVTIRTLLNHRSGLPNYVHFMENMGWDKKVIITNEDVFNFLITRKSEMKDIATPNTRFTYCNTNFALLAMLIEKLSGKKYGDFLQETFFSPLQMNHTFVYDNKTDSGKTLLSYDWRGRIIPLNFLDRVYGDKNIYSTPRDLLTWDRALTSGLLFTQKTLAEAYTPYSNEKPGIRNYGLGWRMNNFANGKKMIYHNGWWHGNNAAFVRLIEDSATIIVLGNKENHGIYHAKDMANLFGNYFENAEDDETEATKTIEQTVKNLPVAIAQPNTTRKEKRLKKTVRVKVVSKQTKPPAPIKKKR